MTEHPVEPWVIEELREAIERNIRFWRRVWDSRRAVEIEARQLAASFAVGPQPLKSRVIRWPEL